MSTNHRATFKQWEAVQLHADPSANCHRDSCILELHYRVEALEAAQRQAAIEESSAAQDDDPQTLHVRRAIREPMEQHTPPATPSTQRAQRLLDELNEGGLPAVLRHLAAAWSVSIDHDSDWVSSGVLEEMAAELEGREVEQPAPPATPAPATPTQPVKPAPTGGLVARLSRLLAWRFSDSRPGTDCTLFARDLLREAAAWLDSRGQHGPSLWLREEADFNAEPSR